MNRRMLIVCLLLIVGGAYIHLVKPKAVLLTKPLTEFPVLVGDWRMIKEDKFSAAIIDVLRPTDYLSRKYVDKQGNMVTLYLGYHGGREGDGGIHSPRNCLPGAGWFLDSTELIPVETQGKEIEIVNTVMSKGANTISFYYWFQVRGRILTDEYSLKIAEVWNSLTARRKDASFIRISMPIAKGERGTSEVLDSFVGDFYPAIRDFLPR